MSARCERHPSQLDNQCAKTRGGTIIVNGPMGVIGITKLSSFTAGFILILITLIIVLNLINSRAGRAIKAVR